MSALIAEPEIPVQRSSWIKGLCGIPVALAHTDDWFAARATGIGASESAPACGMSRYATAYEIYCRKLGLIPEVEDNDSMWFGRELEPVVVKRFSHETGIPVLYYPVPMVRSETHPFMLATLDAVLDKLQLLECKTTTQANYSSGSWGEEETDQAPVEYVFQAQHQMAVVGADVCHIAVIVSQHTGHKLRRYVVERNDRMIEQIIKRESELWDRIQNQDPPEPDWNHASTLDLMKKVHRENSGESVLLSAEFANLRRDRDQKYEQMKQLESEIKKCDAQILKAIGNNALAIFEADENGVPCEFELSRAWVEPTTYEVNRKGYFTVRKRKAK